MLTWFKPLFIAVLFATSVTTSLANAIEVHDDFGPPPELEAEYLAKTTAMKDQLVKDYRTLLRVYYGLKKKSAKPNEFPNPLYSLSMASNESLDPVSRGRFSDKISNKLPEFSLEAYNEFKSQLEKDPRLSGNTFVQRMQEYGSGQANDVFQRIGSYSLEPFEARVDKSVRMELYMNNGNAVTAIGMLEAQEVFKDVSNSAGYPYNGTVIDPARKTEWSDKLKAKAYDLRNELRKMGLTPSLRPSTSKVAKQASACAQGFQAILDN